MKQYRKRPSIVEAVQWPGGLDDVPDGFVLSPPPTDFGVGRSCWHPDLKVLLHRGDWLVVGDGGPRCMANADFWGQYEEAP